MRPIKFFKRLLFYLFVATVVIVVSGGVSVYLYKDRIIEHFITEMNAQLNTPVHVDRFGANIIDNFPYVAITLENVVVEESYSWSTDTLLSAKKIGLSFNPIELLQNQYVVHRIAIYSGTAKFKINRSGEYNYSIFKKAENNKSAVFDLNRIELNNVNFQYINLVSNKSVDLYSDHLRASIQAYGQLFEFKGKGSVLSNSINVNGKNYLENITFASNIHLYYDQSDKIVTINSSSLISNESEFIIKGNYGLSSGEIDISVNNDNTTIQTLLALLPLRYSSKMEKYRSRGKGHLQLSLHGISNSEHSPAIDIQFGLSNTSIFHPEYNTQLDSVSLIGEYASSSFNDLSKAKLKLTDVQAVLSGKLIQGNLELNNLVSPHIKTDFSGELDLTSLLNFYPNSQIEEASGAVVLNVSINGDIQDLKKRSTIGLVKTTGEIDLDTVTIKMKNLDLPYRQVNGKLLFNNNDLAISGLSGYYGSSDFLINGYFKNFVSFMLLENQPVGIKADLQSQLIDLDELLSGGVSFNENNNGNYTLSINPNLILKFNCSIEQLKFRRFLGTSIKGDLLVKDQLASTNDISLNTMEGSIRLAGSVDASTPKIKVFTDAQLNGIAINQAFFVFENFNQDFLIDSHLQGNMKAYVTASMTFNKNLELNAQSLTSDIEVSIINGELNNFEPMQRLSKYLDEHELSALRFSELKNEIHIEDETIYLPEMEVHSNVSNITIGGTHTFDQNIVYTVVAPLNNKKRRDRDEIFGAIEEDKSGRAKVFLKISGTTSDYEVSYDKRAVKKEIISDLKREVQELKDAFKNKGKEEKKEVELEDDDYFDW